LPRTAKAASYADLLVRLATARDARDLKRCKQIEPLVEAEKERELAAHPEHFSKSKEDKARLLLLGWLEGGHKALTKHRFIKKGSFLEETCLWALVEVLRARAGPPPDILRLVASQFVPDSAHGLAHPQLRVVVGKRSPGATENVYAVEQIVAAVEGYERKGFGRDKAVDEVAERLDASKAYIYRLLKDAPKTLNTKPRRRR
jgi:hypothetical protein